MENNNHKMQSKHATKNKKCREYSIISDLLKEETLRLQKLLCQGDEKIKQIGLKLNKYK